MSKYNDNVNRVYTRRGGTGFIQTEQKPEKLLERLQLQDSSLRSNVCWRASDFMWQFVVSFIWTKTLILVVVIYLWHYSPALCRGRGGNLSLISENEKTHEVKFQTQKENKTFVWLWAKIQMSARVAVQRATKGDNELLAPPQTYAHWTNPFDLAHTCWPQLFLQRAGALKGSLHTCRWSSKINSSRVF